MQGTTGCGMRVVFREDRVVSPQVKLGPNGNDETR